MTKGEANLMRADSYMIRSGRTAIYPGQGELTGLMYVALGASNEAGEVAGKVKKMWRDDTYHVPEARKALAAEVGDTIWYLARVLAELDESLGDVMEANLVKLQSRQERGVLGGSGDNR